MPTSIKRAIVTGVMRREVTVDFQTSNASLLSGLTDLEVLAFAAQENRILVSQDQRTMPRYFAEFISTQTSSGVIIVLPSFPVSEAIDNLIKIWQTSESEDWVNRIAYLPL